MGAAFGRQTAEECIALLDGGPGWRQRDATLRMVSGESTGMAGASGTEGELADGTSSGPARDQLGTVAVGRGTDFP
ncbi:hypothetical protein AB0I10_39175 [Streptomyces sp. NPDC050636]|uniref:hypothetical protein n=1 Tax=Streptomyces sp. NPDC050636 TaxID=3154510 RepID=UPI003434DCFE